MTTAPKAPAPDTTSSQHPYPAEDRPIIWIDGRFVPRSQATISVFDHGLLYGDGVFEGIRIYNGQIFKCMSHLDRIYRNAEAIHMMRQGDGFPHTKQEMKSILEQCVEANGLTEGYIRLIFTRGTGTLGLNPFKCPRPTVICIADQISLYPEEMYEQGMRVVVAKRPRTPTACLDPSLKSLNYLNNILAKVEAIDAGCLEAIMLSTDGLVGECTGDNLFIIKDGTAYTSPLDVGMLDGITRAFVISTLCPDLGIDVVQQPLSLDDVLGADEIFLTGSAAEIIAVTQVDDTVISDGEGVLTNRLRSRFRELVTADVIPQD
jgi:branched-chain amino acid aminotransferase